jgi:membrane-bound ClpP family serine protease
MGIDIRLPLGGLFLLLGAILLVYGAVSDPSLYQQSLGINVNLYWGVVLLAFGALMFALSRRGVRATVRAESTTPSTRSGSH